MIDFYTYPGPTSVERTSAQERERWLTQQDEAFTWRLRAETAEVRLAQEAEAATQAR